MVTGAGPMQAPGLFDANPRGKYGLVHNVGLGGAVVCSLLRRPEFYKPGPPDGRDRSVASFFRSNITLVVLIQRNNSGFEIHMENRRFSGIV